MAILNKDDEEILTRPDKVIIPIILVDGYTITCQYEDNKLIPKTTTSLNDVLTQVDDALHMRKTKNSKAIKSSPNNREHSKSVTSFVEHLMEHSEERKRSNTVTSDLESSLESSQESYILPNNKSKSPNIYETALRGELTKHSNQQKEILYTEQLEWLERNFNDYVNTECISTLAEVELLLESLIKSHTCILVTIETNNKGKLHVSYQFLNNFKNEYMIFPVKKDYCILMKTF